MYLPTEAHVVLSSALAAGPATASSAVGYGAGPTGSTEVDPHREVQGSGLPTSEAATIQRLIAQADGYARRVAELEADLRMANEASLELLGRAAALERITAAAGKVHGGPMAGFYPTHLGGCIGGLSDIHCPCGITDLAFAVMALETGR